jgi:hypothetical protein
VASSLYGLARKVSEYARERYGRQYQRADESIERTQPSSYVRSRRSLFDRFRDLLFGKPDQTQPTPEEPARPHSPGMPTGPVTAPPVQQPQQQPRPSATGRPSPAPSPLPPATPLPRPTPSGPWPRTPSYPPPQPPAPQIPGGFAESPAGPLRPGSHVSDELDEIQLLGRDAGYDAADFAAVMEGMRLTPGSSNVYGYYFEREARRTGILYVTFLENMPGGKRSGPGPTYAYYDVSVIKALEFQKASEQSAGNAVWDYLRIRGTVSGHQHNYRLVHVSGDYVPRKATPIGFRNRAVPALGVGRREFQRNTLPQMRFQRGEPNRGGPNRGGPNRGN